MQAALRELDEAVGVASQWQSDPLAALQGPLADALTHNGQLARLRRLDGSPIQGGNYARAEIRAGELRLTTHGAPPASLPTVGNDAGGCARGVRPRAGGVA